MKTLISLVLTLCISFSAVASDDAKEKPTQHLEVAEVTTMQDAKAIFLETTAAIMARKDLDHKAASEIHIITYSLEKSIAYFSENLTGEKQELARKMAVVVEDIHLTSESNRLDALRNHIKAYSNLVDQFLFCF